MPRFLIWLFVLIQTYGFFHQLGTNIIIIMLSIFWLLCQESGHKSTNKFDFQFKLLNLIFGGRSFS
ncbi:hypothetical protein EFE20_05735, partial [Latilactobacillus curvatus]|nr:hypothetical protein [Latilactobacillus curvatus]